MPWEPGSNFSDDDRALLATAREIIDQRIAPAAETVDISGRVPIENLDALAKSGLVGITTPVSFGGTAVGDGFLSEFCERVCAACGTTWFVLTQHLGACGQFASSSNPTLREKYLREMATGKRWVGVGFGHLRRPKPMVTAIPDGDGWILNGVAPWVTGWPILSHVIVGATLPDDRFFFACVAVDAPGVSSSAPLPLCAMNASETVEMTLENVRVRPEEFVRYSSRDEMRRGDLKVAARNVGPIFGVTLGALGQLRGLAAKRQSEPFLEAVGAIETQLSSIRARCDSLSNIDIENAEQVAAAHRVRAEAIDLSVRAAHLAVAASSGGANSRENAAQRRVREAMFYVVFQQTAEIQSATLEILRRA